MTIHFYQNSPFPYGMAAAKRRLCYIKGLNAAGDTIDVIITNKVFEKGDTDGFEQNDEYEGTPFYYVAGKYKHAKWNRLLRGLDWVVLDPIRTLSYSLRKINNKDIVYVYLYPLFLQCLILLAAKIRGANIIKEVCEHPDTQRKTSGILKKFASWIEFHIIMKFYDGFIVISHDLEQLVKKNKSKKAKIILIPILVDDSAYNQNNVGECPPINAPYIIHTGTMQEEKDSISKILKAFARFKKECNSNLKIVFTGKSSDPQKCKYLPLIKELGIEQDTILMGYVSDNEIVKLQSFACMSIIYKSDNLQTRNCFPTKLGEMLLSEVPVITTSIGDAKLYLKSGESALIFEPDEETALVNHIQTLINDPDLRKKIALKGKKVALEHFNPIKQGRRLSVFFQNLT